MPKVSFRLPDDEYERLHMLRGNRSISDYIRSVLSAQHKEAKTEIGEFQNLFRDVTMIRETLLKDLPNQHHLLALAEYLKDVMTIANPPAYANYRDKLQELFQRLKTSIASEG